MNDATTSLEQDIDTADRQADAPQSDPPKSRAERRPATLDIAAGMVTLDGVSYAIKELPNDPGMWCCLRGLASRLQAAEDPAAAFADLKAGKIPSHGPAKPKELDPWRRAYAHALADKQAKDSGIKAKSPEYAALLEEKMQHAAGVERSALAKIKVNPAVVTHWCRITGADVAL